ncbi:MULTISPECIES: glycosyltransferase family 4 protein [Cupriavidus]|uniref:Glycosyltransferase family 1 protein n=1 Tax=Cupriavidus pauculus TaxID=82633 RepID=A0A3G8H364_9BURK|nr:glycosyltransferase family 1 protein [Cupriavidus pauculus]AZG14844.1 glycosyltransferase family 1 protein [Cupriavidus pauculus]
MRIGVDGFNLALPNGSGVATYARTLAWSLARMGHDVDLVYGLAVGARTAAPLREVLFFDALDRPRRVSRNRLAAIGTACADVLGRTAVHVPRTDSVIARGLEARVPDSSRLFTSPDLFDAAARHFRRHGRFLRLRVPDPPDIMHWTYPLPVRIEGARNIYTIHDLVPLRLPYTSLENKRYHYRLVRACLRDGDHVCTVSEASRADLLRMFPAADPARITNTWQAVMPVPLADADDGARLATAFELAPRGYFLYFGAIEPKKNIGRLVEGYLAAQVDTPLVIVGARAWKSAAETRLLHGDGGHPLRGVSERIRRYDYLPRPWLMTLVRQARAVAFPSIYEGFGLPVLEAMAVGTPVLTSNVASLPEVAGDAALMVDPYSVSDIAAGFRRLDADADLRAQLSALGPRQAQRFAPEPYQARLRAMYARVLSLPDSP